MTGEQAKKASEDVADLSAELPEVGHNIVKHSLGCQFGFFGVHFANHVDDLVALLRAAHGQELCQRSDRVSLLVGAHATITDQVPARQFLARVELAFVELADHVCDFFSATSGPVDFPDGRAEAPGKFGVGAEELEAFFFSSVFQFVSEFIEAVGVESLGVVCGAASPKKGGSADANGSNSQRFQESTHDGSPVEAIQKAGCQRAHVYSANGVPGTLLADGLTKGQSLGRVGSSPPLKPVLRAKGFMAEAILFEVFLLAAGVTVVLTGCHFLKVPTLIGFIITGILVGPHGFSVVSELPSATSLTEFASILLMFTIGLEFSFQKLLTLRRVFLGLGLVQVMVTIGVVFLGAWWLFDLPFERSVVWGMAIALSSTALVLKLLQDFGEEQTPHGQNSLGILLFQDVAVIPMMMTLSLLGVFANAGESAVDADAAASPFSLGGLAATGGLLVAALAGAALLSRWGVPQLLEVIAGTKRHELFFFGLIFVALGLGEFFHAAGLSVSLGAFIAGVMIAESPFNHQATAVFSRFRDTFLGIFFAAVGMLLDLNFVVENLTSVLLLGGLLFLVKLSLVFGICQANRFTLSTSIFTAFTVCQVGEFSFLLASEASTLGVFEESDSQYFLAVSILSMVFTPLLYALAPHVANAPAKMKLRSVAGQAILTQVENTMHQSSGDMRASLERNNGNGQESQKIVVVGYGIAGQNVSQALSNLGAAVSVVESDYGVVKKHRRLGADITFGDAAHLDVLKHAGVPDAQLVVITVANRRALEHVVQQVRQLRPDVPIVARAFYMRDLQNMRKVKQIQFVVAEVETAAELVTQSLKVVESHSR